MPYEGAGDERALATSVSRGALSCGVIAFFAAAAHLALAREFTLDDAYIHLCYAKSLWLGDGFSYNPGDQETGASSPLWSLLLTPLAGLADPTLPVKLLGALLHGAAAALACALAERLAHLERPRPTGMIAGLLVGLSPLQLHAATSGMETPLAAACLLAAAWAVVARRPLASFAWSALSVWSRPELLVCLATLGAGFAFFRREPRALGAVAGAVLAQGVWSAWNLYVSGFPFPNTYYVKAHALDPQGLWYFAKVVAPREAWMLSLGGAAAWGIALRRSHGATRMGLQALVTSALVGIVAVALSRQFKMGVLFWQWRYFAPLLPLLALPVAWGVLLVRRRVAVYVMAVPLLAASAWRITESAIYYQGLAGDVEQHVGIAHWLDAKLPEAAVIGVETAGASRFFTRRSIRIVDLAGLNDREFAHVRSKPAERVALIQRRKLTHLDVPSAWVAPLSTVLHLQPLASFERKITWSGPQAGALRMDVLAVQ